MRRALILGVVALVALPGVIAQAVEPPLYESRVLPLPDDVVGLMDGASEAVYEPTGVRILPLSSCAAENAFEEGISNRYPASACRRMSIVFGPIQARPGQDDVLIQPVTFEKPMYPGYITRFKPDLVAADGQPPRVKDVHLHHGTWFTGVLGAGSSRSYGWGPWIASGEEKTIATWPKGFGLKIEPTDTWSFLHMVHNATAQTFPVWVRYDLDFVDADWAELDDDGDGLKNVENTKGIWLDVGDCGMKTRTGGSVNCEKDTFNPVFNIHRGMGSAEPGACIFPRENCAQFNTFGTGKLSAQQGAPVEGGAVDDWPIPIDGTLVNMGGHLHSGGLRDDVYLVRDLDEDGLYEVEEQRLIHRSDAYYWDHQRPDEFDPFDITKNVVGGPPVSWDMVMTGVTRDLGWSINVKKDDRLRLEGVYDNRIGTWYEQMGIVMSWIAPKDDDTPWLGVDPFGAGVVSDGGVLQHPDVVQPPTVEGYSLPGSTEGDGICAPGNTTICVRGSATHTRNETSADHDTCGNLCPTLAETAPNGQIMTDIPIGGFSYGPAELGTVATFGIPLVKVDEPVTFWNLDTADDMWHTVTRCKLPCSGETQASYPLADGAWDDLYDPDSGVYTRPDGVSASHPADLGPDPMDFDSGIVGFGTGANNKFNDVNRQTPAQWTWTPTRTGTFTFWCRIHPSMRGAVRVVA